MFDGLHWIVSILFHNFYVEVNGKKIAFQANVLQYNNQSLPGI